MQLLCEGDLRRNKFEKYGCTVIGTTDDKFEMEIEPLA
jgi:hypothetical protein